MCRSWQCVRNLKIPNMCVSGGGGAAVLPRSRDNGLLQLLRILEPQSDGEKKIDDEMCQNFDEHATPPTLTVIVLLLCNGKTRIPHGFVYFFNRKKVEAK